MDMLQIWNQKARMSETERIKQDLLDELDTIRMHLDHDDMIHDKRSLRRKHTIASLKRLNTKISKYRKSHDLY